MSNLDKLMAVRAQIHALAEKYQRSAGDVELIAVSKTRSADEILELHTAGQMQFGENYLQEALDKIALLRSYPITWHFIGAIQSRKAAQIAENFSWVHSVDRLKVATKLNQHTRGDTPLNVLIQVNLEGEASKGGVAPSDLQTLAQAVNELENLRLRGLMFMPRIHTRLADQRAVFRRAKVLFDELQLTLPQIDQISMGMSGDMEAAIAEGATMVRVGTALFGERE